MGSVSNKERARRAFDAMKALGFSRKEVAPVLRNLLKLFEDNWEPIEDECYRALADAVLDARARPQEQEQCTSLVVHGGPCGEESETDPPRIKRPRTSPTDFSADHSIHPRLSGPSAMEVQYDVIPASRRAPIQSCQVPADAMPSSVTARTRARQMIDEDFQDAVFLREPKPEPDLDDENVQVGIISHPCNNSSDAAVPPTLPPPPDHDSSKVPGTAIQHYKTKTTSVGGPMNNMVKQHQNQQNPLFHTAVVPNTRTGKRLEASRLQTVIASSTTDEVKMLIECSMDPSKFHMPDLKAVFKMVEDKYRRLYKILPPNFSVESLMNEICQCVAQLGNGHTAEQNIQSDAFDNGRNSQKEPMTSSALFLEPIACFNNMNIRIGNCKSAEEPLILEGSENGPPYSIVPQHTAALSDSSFPKACP